MFLGPTHLSTDQVPYGRGPDIDSVPPSILADKTVFIECRDSPTKTFSISKKNRKMILMSELESKSLESLSAQVAALRSDLDSCRGALDHAIRTGELCPKCHRRMLRDEKRGRGLVYLRCQNQCQPTIKREIRNAETVSE